jgi:starch synthase
MSMCEWFEVRNDRSGEHDRDVPLGAAPLHAATALVPVKVLFAAAEALPFAKVGGLADVAGALTKELARRGHEVTLLLPAYPGLQGKPVASATIPLGDTVETVCFERLGSHHGVGVHVARSDPHFARERIYGHVDDIARFVLFSRAAVAFAGLGSPAPDVIHAHDWHTGLVPHEARAATDRRVLPAVATVLTVHNLGYQGRLDEDAKRLARLPEGSEDSLVAEGIAWADCVNTVSEGYLREIVTPEGGHGLDRLLRSRAPRLRGIRNGVDYGEFDPRRDGRIVAPYSADALAPKRMSKAELQRRSGLRVDPRVPLVAMVARLVDQKGLELLCESLDRLPGLGVQLAVMGIGRRRYSRFLEAATRRHPGAVSYHATSDEALARLFYAGSDFFLAPSAYEPCGLGPLIALRYGSIPIVRRTGGMADTIPDYTRDPGNGLGFTFVPQYPEHLVRTVQAALTVYRNEPEWIALTRRAMAADFGWEASASAYERLYMDAIDLRGAEVHGVARAAGGALSA